MSDITIYTTPTCGYCKMAKGYFISLGHKFKEIDISTNQQGQYWVINTTGQMGTPVIKIDEKVIIGFDRAAIDEVLKQK